MFEREEPLAGQKDAMRKKSAESSGRGDVPPGYKRTEVGVIPEDWEAKRLGDIIHYIVGGGTPSRNNPAYWGNGIPWVTVKDFASFNPETTQESITMEGLNKSASHRVPAGTIILSTRMAVGHVVIYNVDVAINQDLKGIFLNEGVVTDYVFHWFRYNSKKIGEFGSGSTVKGLSLADLKRIEFKCPGIDEQEAIATALSEADALIDSLDRLIAKKRAIKQAAMQQLLTGQTRLPGFEGEWEKKRLGDIIHYIVGGGTPSRNNPTYWGNGIPWVTVKDFASFNPETTQESITIEGLNKSASHRVPAGTIILSTRMAVGHVIIYNVDVTINQDLKGIFLNEGVVTDYIFHWFRYNSKKIGELGSGSTVKGLSLADLKRIEFKCPGIDEQRTIATVLSDMDAEIQALERRRNKARQIKQGMMQQLLTGRIRLVNQGDVPNE